MESQKPPESPESEASPLIMTMVEDALEMQDREPGVFCERLKLLDRDELVALKSYIGTRHQVLIAEYISSPRNDDMILKKLTIERKIANIRLMRFPIDEASDNLMIHEQKGEHRATSTQFPEISVEHESVNREAKQLDWQLPMAIKRLQAYKDLNPMSPEANNIVIAGLNSEEEYQDTLYGRLKSNNFNEKELSHFAKYFEDKVAMAFALLEDVGKIALQEQAVSRAPLLQECFDNYQIAIETNEIVTQWIFAILQERKGGSPRNVNKKSIQERYEKDRLTVIISCISERANGAMIH